MEKEISKEEQEKHLDKTISFHKKEMIKARKKGDYRMYAKHSNVLDLMYEIKRSL